LNGDGTNAANTNHLFLKVQAQTSNGNFSNAACYTGNNAGSFGLGFFTLTQQFSRAHMKASRSGSTATIAFTNVNGGALPNQTYTCTGAPTAAGDKIGIASYADNTSTIDNFSNGTTVVDTFSFSGALASSGNWRDAAAGMHANGVAAVGGASALSFFIGTVPSCPATVAVSGVPDGASILQTLYSFRDNVLRQSDQGSAYIDMFYKNSYEASWALLRNANLRFRVALMLWRQQGTIQAVIQHRPAAVSSWDLAEVDNLIGSFLQSASTGFAKDLNTIRQGLRDRTILAQYGIRVTD